MGIKVTMAPKWTSLLSQEIEKDYFQALLSFLTEEYAKDHVVPSKDNVFKPFRLTDYDKVKVVIIGQDPYPGVGQANGLAFGVPDDFYPKPKTFGEIIKELCVGLWKSGRYTNALDPLFDIKGSSMEGWAQQGVLMLNACLTTEKGKPRAHRGKGWERFVTRALKYLGEQENRIVFIAWGEEAKALLASADVNRNGHHLILTAGHPSTLAARSKKPFSGCDHFNKANAFLSSHGIQPIDWIKISSH